VNDNVWHPEGSTPGKTVFKKSIPPGMSSTTPWLVTGIRGKEINTVIQRNGAVDFEAAFEMMPFIPQAFEARKKIIVRESGIQAIALGYDPSHEQKPKTAEEMEQLKKDGGVSAYTNDMSSKPKAANMEIFLEKDMGGGKLKRTKLVTGQLEGNAFTGELRFFYANLPKGDYYMTYVVHSVDVKYDRMGEVQFGQLQINPNSDFSIFQKGPHDDAFLEIQ